MKITLKTDNIEAVRKKLESIVYDNFSHGNAMLELEHQAKRQEAEAVLKGDVPSAEFAEAAAIEDLKPEELAALIVSKADRELIAKGNNRRRLIRKVRAAKTLAELEAIKNGISPSDEKVLMP